MFMPSKDSFAAARALSPVGAALLPAPVGMVAGSLVETADGWTPVEALGIGARVQTYDGGAQPVTAIRRVVVGRGLCPDADVIRVPGGALDTCADLLLPPSQQVLIHSSVAEAVLGLPAVLVEARSLVGFHGIGRVAPPAPVTLIALEFAAEEIVFANSGALVHCAAGPRAGAMPVGDEGFFPTLDAGRAGALLGLIAAGALSTADLARAA